MGKVRGGGREFVVCGLWFVVGEREFEVCSLWLGGDDR